MIKVIILNHKDKNLLVKNGLLSKYLSSKREVLSGHTWPYHLYLHDTSIGATSWLWEVWFDSGEGYVKVKESTEKNVDVYPELSPLVGTGYVKLTINGGASSVQSKFFSIEYAPPDSYNIRLQIASDTIYNKSDSVKLAITTKLQEWDDTFSVEQQITYAEIIAAIESVPGVNHGDVLNSGGNIGGWTLDSEDNPVDPVSDPIIPSWVTIVRFKIVQFLLQPS